MNKELATLESSEVGLARQSQVALERLRTSDLDETRDILRDASDLKALLQRRGWALESLYPLSEVKVTAERKIGQQRAEFSAHQSGSGKFNWQEAKRLMESGVSRKETARRLGVDPVSIRYAEERGYERKTGSRAAFDRQIGVRAPTATSWQRLGEINDSLFGNIIEEIKDEGLEITTARILYRARANTDRAKILVESGIYQLVDGRLMLRYRDRGRYRQEVLQTKNVATARKTLIERRGLGKAPSGKGKATGARQLDAAYTDVRCYLDRLDDLLPRLASSTARRNVEQAMAFAHKSEDEIVKALKAETIDEAA